MAENYTVTGQRTTLDPTLDGTLSSIVEITFKTKPHGIVSTARVPAEQYNPVDVDQILSAAAKNIEEVHTL